MAIKMQLPIQKSARHVAIVGNKGPFYDVRVDSQKFITDDQGIILFKNITKAEIEALSTLFRNFTYDLAVSTGL